MRPKIDIITISVENLDLSTGFYRKVFGLPEDKISSGEDHVAFFLDGEMSLVLYDRSGFALMTEQDQDKLNAPSVIFSHTAKDHMEVNAIISRALNAGGTVMIEGAENDWGYSGVFKDIDGYTWEVMSSIGRDESEDIMHLPISWEEKGKIEGIKEGRIEGIREGKREVALEMLNEGFPIDIIVKVTQLDREEIEKLKADSKK